jgi:hypothetical protein
VDRYPGGEKHRADLEKLQATRAELVAAAKWATTHDPSPAFRAGVAAALEKLGAGDIDDL